MRAIAPGTFIAILIFACIGAGLFGGCASMGMPTGGPRDTLAPVLVSVTPADSGINFNAKRIVLTFDEFVQLDNPQDILVSPTPIRGIETRSHLRTVTVVLRDTLEPNTTYSIDFGTSIRDINEQNAVRGYTYLFTTGTTIDSLELEGKVVLAESGKIDSTLMVVLHTRFDDSAVTRTPRYRAKLDAQGNFRFRYLPADTFALYALKDESGRGIYQSGRDLFAFADSLVHTLSPPNNIVLYAYREERETTPPARAAPQRPAAANRQQGQDRRLQFTLNLQENMLDLLDTLQITFPLAPLRNFDSTKVIVLNEQFAPVSGVRFTRDTSNTKITLDHNWIPNSQYHMILDRDFAEDTAGRKLLKTDTLSFITRKESDYGSLRLRFVNLNLSQNPVLLFVQNDAIIHSHVITGREFSARMFRPGEYELRILYDENKNGVWDPGKFFGERRQPERVITLPKRFNVRANFDNEVDVNL